MHLWCIVSWSWVQYIFVLRLWCYALSAISRRLATAVAHLLYIIIIWPKYMIRPEIWLLFLNLNSDGFSSIMLIDSGATWIETCWTNFINFSKKLNVSQLCFVGFNFIIYPFIFDLFAGGSKVFWDRFIYEESFWWKCFRWTILFLQILTFFFLQIEPNHDIVTIVQHLGIH